MNTSKIIKSLCAISVCAGLAFLTNDMALANGYTNSDNKLSTWTKQHSKQENADAQMIIQAVAANRLSVIKQMVDDGVDINLPALGDGTALMIAIGKSNNQMVDDLISLGADVNTASPGDGNPLILASKLGNLTVVKKLISLGAVVDQQVAGDETPLINASSQGELAIVKYLVEKGADVNLSVLAKTRNGDELRSPLNQASSHSVRQYLISQGAQQE